MGDFKKIFDLLRTDEITLIAITGGEPTEHPQICEIIDFVYNKTKIKPLVSTNGLNSKRLKNILLEVGNKVSTLSLPIDGSLKTHNLHRGVSNAFQEVMKSIEIAKEFNLKLRFAITILKDNVDYVPILLRKYGDKNFDVKCTSTSRYYYGDNAEKNFRDHQLDRRLYLHLTAYYKKHKVNNLYNFYNIIYMMHGVRPICSEGGSELFITFDGKIFGCYHKKELINLKDYNKEKLEKNRKKFINKNIFCTKCFGRCGSTSLEVYKRHYQSIANEIRSEWIKGKKFPEKRYFNKIKALPFITNGL